MPSIPTPSEFLCSLTQTIIVQPVLATNGKTYEQSSIIQWLVLHKDDDPKPEIDIDGLTPNYELKEKIQEYYEQNQLISKEEFFNAFRSEDIELLKSKKYPDAYLDEKIDGFYLLQASIGYGKVQMALHLLDVGILQRLSGREDFLSPLYMASIYGLTSVAQKLIDLGENVNYFDQNGKTPLMMAAMFDQLEMVELLVKSCANLEQKDRGLCTPLQLATFADKVEAAKLLLRLGSDPKSTDIFGGTPLHLAALKGHTDLVELLLQHCPVDVQNQVGHTPLLMACEAGHIVTVRQLLAAGANPRTEKTLDGQTSLHIAVRFGHLEVAKLLVENKNSPKQTTQPNSEELSREQSISVSASNADIDAMDDAGFTPLHSAAASQQEICFRYLLDIGADCEVKTVDGFSVTDLARNPTFEKIVAEHRRKSQQQLRNAVIRIQELEREVAAMKSKLMEIDQLEERLEKQLHEKLLLVVSGKSTRTIQLD